MFNTVPEALIKSSLFSAYNASLEKGPSALDTIAPSINFFSNK